MSTQLHIDVVQPHAEGFLEVGAIAGVRLLSDVHGAVAATRWSREQSVRVQGRNDRERLATIFELPSGGYYGVTIVRPRSTDIEREYLVAEGEVRRETITLPTSPHEYLGWQQFAQVIHSPASRPLPADIFSELLGGTLDFKAMRREPSTEPPPPAPEISSAAIPSSADAWQVVEMMSRTKMRQVNLLNRLDWLPLPDPAIVSWLPKMPDAGEGMQLVERLGPTPSADPSIERRFPRWLWFQSDRHADLASVPWGWWGPHRESYEEIRFSYDLLQRNPIDQSARGRLMISVQDSRWFSLLEFLASGRLCRAGKIFNSVRSLEGDGAFDAVAALEGKVKGPLPAVAGAIVLVTRETSNERQSWDPWLDNLSKFFPGIPDGPILLGYRRLQQATTHEAMEMAFSAVAAGIQRGIPFFAASIRLAALALARFGDDFDTESLSRRIAYASARVDADQPFTVIRL
jgi:hypothetical protein